MTSKILYLFTRTPLHVGAGASVGAIDQPIQRERHTGFPIIPATGQKGSFADQWPTPLRNEKSESARVVEEGKAKPINDADKAEITTLEKDVEKDGRKQKVKFLAHQSAWLFGSDNPDLSFAGALIFSEARVLAFPIRSAKGSYAWITCPLMLQRAARDGVILAANIPAEPKDEQAIFKTDGPLVLTTRVNGVDTHQIVLEEYCFTHTSPGNTKVFGENGLAKALAALVDDALFQSITDRLVILSNGMMSHFATTACEIAQHVRISDETGTADPGGLFNQENVPADTLFYAVLSATKSRVPGGDLRGKSEVDALTAFKNKIEGVKVFQFGGDASTGLGFCTVTLNTPQGA